METDSFLTLARPAEAEVRVKASRFLAIAAPIGVEAEARDLLAERERSYFDARHHCAAWRLRDGTWRAIDAGEPAGSAGPPILAAIERFELVDVAVVVTRYFGGTKLGIGGLARAYGEAAEAALEAAPKRRGIKAARIRIDYPFTATAVVMRALERFNARSVEHDVNAAGTEAVVTAVLPEAALPSVESFLQEQTSGRVGFVRLEDSVLWAPVDPGGATGG